RGARRPLEGAPRDGAGSRCERRASLRSADGKARTVRNAGGLDGGTLVLRPGQAHADLRMARRARVDGEGSEQVDYFYSFRSPYSYLSAPRVFALPETFDVEIAFHGVIPMAMRGQSVPRAKRLHTIRDVAREARRLGIPFGRIHDPIGDGAMRCLLVAAHTARSGREPAFVLSAGRAIWSEAVDVSSDEGLRAV